MITLNTSTRISVRMSESGYAALKQLANQIPSQHPKPCAWDDRGEILQANPEKIVLVPPLQNDPFCLVVGGFGLADF